MNEYDSLHERLQTEYQGHVWMMRMLPDGTLHPPTNKGGKKPEAFLIPYDWRKCNWENARLLATEIPKLRQWMPDASQTMPFTMIAHSMGGILARLLLEHPSLSSEIDEKVVDNLMTFGTPHLGSLDAIAILHGRTDKINGGQDWLGPFNKEEEARLATACDSAYQLLPLGPVVLPDYQLPTKYRRTGEKREIITKEKTDPAYALWKSKEHIPYLDFLERQITLLKQQPRRTRWERQHRQNYLNNLRQIQQRLTDDSNGPSNLEILQWRDQIRPGRRTYSFFASTHHPTKALFVPKVRYNQGFLSGKGDGTVPSWSAVPSVHSVQCSHPLQNAHQNLLKEQAALDLIFDALKTQQKQRKKGT